jgi:hypothetical protein
VTTPVADARRMRAPRAVLPAAMALRVQHRSGIYAPLHRVLQPAPSPSTLSTYPTRRSPTRALSRGVNCDAGGVRDAVVQMLKRAVERAVALRLLFGVHAPLAAVLTLCRRLAALLFTALHPVPPHIATWLKLGARANPSPSPNYCRGFG